MHITFTIFLLLLISPYHPISCTENMERELRDYLFTNFSRSVRPVQRVEDAVTLAISVELIQIIELSESDQYISAKLWFTFEWNDDFMRWNPQEWGLINKTRFTLDEIWTPDIYVIEAVSETISEDPTGYRTPIMTSYKGKHSWWVPVNMKSSCIIDVERFPFDIQTCSFTFVSWTHALSELDLQVVNPQKPLISDSYVKSSVWTVLNVTIGRSLKRYACCGPEEFAHIVVTVQVQRKPLYYVVNIVLPCLVHMVIILSTFFLPPDSGERIGVVVTVLLVFALYLEVIGHMLPKCSNSTPALAQFYRMAMFESACALLCTCFVVSIHFKGIGKGVKPIPRVLRLVFIEYIAPLFCLRQPKDSSAGSRIETYDLKNALMKLNIDFFTGPEAKVTDTDTEALLRELRIMTAAINEEKKEDEILEEWQFLATVFDRIFFLFYFIVFIASSYIILISATKDYRSVANYDNVY